MTDHGHTKNYKYTPTYSSWQCMLARCRYTQRDVDLKYINRGITVCDRWLSYKNFLSDMKERPSGTTLDRIDNNLGYSPDNCRWSDPVQQARNRRNARLDYDKAFDIAKRMLAGEKASALAKEYEISESLPREIHNGRAWKDAYYNAWNTRA